MKEKIQFQNLKKEKSEIKNNITERDIKIRKLTFNNSFRRKNTNDFEKFHKINFNSFKIENYNQNISSYINLGIINSGGNIDILFILSFNFNKL